MTARRRAATAALLASPRHLSPRRSRRSRPSSKKSGWGTFRIHAKATYKDGSDVELHHDLVLLYPDGTPTTA